MKKSSTQRRPRPHREQRKGGRGKSVLSFFFGMLMGIILFVGAIAGTIYAVLTAVSIGEIMDSAGADPNDVFDQGSDMPDNSLWDLALKLYGDVPNIGNMTLNELTQKYGVSNKLEGYDNIEGIDISSLFDLPITEIPKGLHDIIMGITLNNVGNIADLDFAEYGIPILTDNLNIPIVDAVDIILSTLGGELTLRQIEDNFGITLGDGGIFDAIKDTPLSQLSNVVDGLRMVDLIGVDNDRFVASGNNQVYVKTDRYEVVPLDEFDHINKNAVSYICGIEDNILLERELRFVQKSVVDEDGNKQFVTDENGNPVYIVDNSCYEEADPDKIYYRYYEYEPYDFNTMPVTSTFYVKTYGNHFIDKGFGYELVEDGFIALSSLASNEEGNGYVTEGNFVNLDGDIYVMENDSFVKADEYGVDPFIHEVDSSTLLTLGNKGYAKIHTGTADGAVQVISYLAIGSIENATDELQGVKLGDVLEINEDSAHILQVMKDTCLKDLSMSIDDLFLSDVVDITYSLYQEDPNGDYIFVTLPTDKYVEYDEALHAGKDKYYLSYEEDENGKYVRKDGEYYYYDEDDTALAGLQRYSQRFYPVTGTGHDNFYVHDKGGYYTLYHPKYGTNVTRYSKQTPPAEFAGFNDFILAPDFVLDDDNYTKFYWDGTKMVEGVVEGQPIYIPGKASSKVIQRLASTTIGNLSKAFDDLILSDVIDIDPDIYEITYDTSDVNERYYYEVDGVFFEASQDFIAENSDKTYYILTSKGTSHIVMRMMAHMPVLQIGDRMNEIVNELYLEDLIDIYEFNIIEEDLVNAGVAGDYFTPYDEDYDKVVGDETYHYAFIPNPDGKYYLRDHDFAKLTDEQAMAFISASSIPVDSASYTYAKYAITDITSATSALASIGSTFNAYFEHEGEYHYNPALCTYIISKFIKDGSTEGMDSVYFRTNAVDTVPTYVNYQYKLQDDSFVSLLYVHILGNYVPYDASNPVHADLDKYILLRDGFDLASPGLSERQLYYFDKSTNQFTTESNSNSLGLTFFKHSLKAIEDSVALYYYVSVDFKYNEDFTAGIVHQRYAKQLAENTYVCTDEASATHAYVDGHVYEIDTMPNDAVDVVYIKEELGCVFNIANDEEVASVLSIMDPSTFKVSYIQQQSVAALKAFAAHDVKVGKLNEAVNLFTVSDMVRVEPDSILDNEDIRNAKLNELSSVFQKKLKFMTIKDILTWGSITTLRDNVFSIIGEATLEDFFAALTYENGEIHVNFVNLYVNIYETQREAEEQA